MQRYAVRAALIALVALPPWLARADETDQERAQRWHDLATTIFAGKPVADGSDRVSLDAPPRALDAALVPVTVTLADAAHVKGLWLIIDDNPSPMAAHFTFGPAADPHVLKTRVRVDQYTLIHAVVEATDGSLYETARFVKAAGGCSAPAGGDAAEAMRRIGRMRLALHGVAPAGKPQEAELLVSHPNFNGMQMDPVTRLYTPARYVQAVDVTIGGTPVFHLDGDIALSENPAVTFSFLPKPGAAIAVDVRDSTKAEWKQSFPAESKPS